MWSSSKEGLGPTGDEMRSFSRVCNSLKPQPHQRQQLKGGSWTQIRSFSIVCNSGSWTLELVKYHVLSLVLLVTSLLTSLIGQLCVRNQTTRGS